MPPTSGLPGPVRNPFEHAVCQAVIGSGAAGMQQLPLGDPTWPSGGEGGCVGDFSLGRWAPPHVKQECELQPTQGYAQVS